MDHYLKGQWAACCDRCGQQFKSGRLRREHTGLMVCSGAGTNNCWDPKHPNDAKPVPSAERAPPWLRPEAPDVYASPATQPQTQDEL